MSQLHAVLSLALITACGSCGSTGTPAPAASTTPAAVALDANELVGHTPDGRLVAVAFDRDGIITSTAMTGAAPSAPAGATTRYLWPPIIDSHVHLAFWPVADQLAAHGVEAAVDLAAPEATLGLPPLPIRVIAAGPMLTHPGGYPLDAWGSAGYGAGCDDAECVRDRVESFANRGAKVIKIALDDDGLAPALVPVAVQAAHARNLRVAVHALTDASALLAAQADVDILAHTPVEPMRRETIAAWKGRAVISTLAAFGGGDAAIANLAALRAAGCTILYGTDLGNLRDTGPSADEVALLRKAGLDDAAITAAMTTTPVAYWGWSKAFAIAPGADATLLVLDGDPRRDAHLLLAPHAIYARGKRM